MSEKKNIGNCRLCGKYGVLCKSHFIPNSYIKKVKKMGYGKSFSGTGGIRYAQDLLKPYFLCRNCENIFSKYEKYFKENVYDLVGSNETLQYDSNAVRYFVFSIAWRYLQYDFEQSKQRIEQKLDYLKNSLCDTTHKHAFDEAADKAAKNNIYFKYQSQMLEKWRQNLLCESHADIKQIPLYLIPIERITPFIDIKGLAGEMSVSFGLHRESQYSIIKIPRFFLVCSTSGHVSDLNQFRILGQLNCYTDITPEVKNIFIKCLDKLHSIRSAEEEFERARSQKKKQ